MMTRKVMFQGPSTDTFTPRSAGKVHDGNIISANLYSQCNSLLAPVFENGCIGGSQQCDDDKRWMNYWSFDRFVS